MIVKLLTEHHLECLSLKGSCRSLSESTHVKMPHGWKSHVTAHVWIQKIPEGWGVLKTYLVLVINVFYRGPYGGPPLKAIGSRGSYQNV